jgi:hypothetical protein
MIDHTPGPWMAHSRNGRIIMAGDTKVATAERTVNASLIAAAPDLLEACKAVAETIKDLGPLWLKPPYQAEAVHETAYERLIGVIEQAEGTE